MYWVYWIMEKEFEEVFRNINEIYFRVYLCLVKKLDK